MTGYDDLNIKIQLILAILIFLDHHANMSVKCTPPYTPLLYSKTGVYRGIHFFLIFALKPTINVLEQKEKYYNFSSEN